MTSMYIVEILAPGLVFVSEDIPLPENKRIHHLHDGEAILIAENRSGWPLADILLMPNAASVWWGSNLNEMSTKPMARLGDIYHYDDGEYRFVVQLEDVGDNI